MGSEACQDASLSIGMVNFINTSPILCPWKRHIAPEGIRLVEDVPTALNALLDSGDIDLGLVSSFAYARQAERYVLFPDLGISATGAVQSVLLLSKVPYQQLSDKKIVLTKQSATSVNLLRIVLEDFMEVAPEYVSGTFEDAAKDDVSAYLAIGDEALYLARNLSGWYVLDLAEVWMEKTGLPFVFAVFAISLEAASLKTDLLIKLWKFLKTMVAVGQMHLDDVSEEVCDRIPMSHKDTVLYLRDIEFDLSYKKQEGLRLFFKYLADKRLITPVRGLAFFDICYDSKG